MSGQHRLGRPGAIPAGDLLSTAVDQGWPDTPWLTSPSWADALTETLPAVTSGPYQPTDHP